MARPGRRERHPPHPYLGLIGVVLNGRFRPGTRASPARAAGFNVLLVTIDTLRADAVGAYGQPGGVTPWIDRLASSGARFTNAHAHNVVTLPSHANILSGRLPTEHGVRDNAGFRFPLSLDTLATILKAHGYRTGAFVSAFPLDSRFGLARGFDEYDDRFADAARPAFLVQERSGPETVASARRWIDSGAAAPWFCWVHLYEPHYPYAPPAALASRFADPYHGDVSAADAALQPLLAPILAAGRDGRTLVVLTSDHGESLGEHGEATHGVFAYEAALRVPLIVYQPRLVAEAVIDTPARHIDLLPTILDAVALESPSGLPGKSLLPSMAGSRETTAAATYFEALSASLNRRWAPLDGIVVDSMKYIELPIPELYDLKADPNELHNLAPSQPARVEELRSRLQQLRGPRASVAPGVESAETRERLRSLGYAAGGSPGRPRAFHRSGRSEAADRFRCAPAGDRGPVPRRRSPGRARALPRASPRAARHAADALPSRPSRKGEWEPGRRDRRAAQGGRDRARQRPRRSPCLAPLSPRPAVRPKPSHCSIRSRGDEYADSRC